MNKNTKKRIAIFLAITFVLMYGTHALIALFLAQSVFVFEAVPIRLLAILGGGAPAFAALFLVYRYYQDEEKKRYWKSVFRFNVAWYWWVFIFVAPMVVGLITNLIMHRSLEFFTWEFEYIIAIPITFAVMIFTAGVEELGWRGILQKHLHGHWKLPLIGVLIGIVWGVWHLPLFFIDAFALSDYAFSAYILSTILFSLWMTGVVFKTKSVGLAILMHAALNTFGNFDLGIPMKVDLVNYIVLGIAIIVSILWLMFLEKQQKTNEFSR